MTSKYQQVLRVITDDDDFRATVQPGTDMACGRSAQEELRRVLVSNNRGVADPLGPRDQELVHWDNLNDVPVSKIGGPCPDSYPTPLHALADGWFLLAPPVARGNGYEWWFARSVLSQNGDM